MKIAFVNFASGAFLKYQRFACFMARTFGGFDDVRCFGLEDIDIEFRKRNKEVLSIRKGGGLWLWKPYIVLNSLRSLSEGDYLFYSDAGAFFINKVSGLISALERDEQDLMGFGLPLLERQWTKRELFLNLGATEKRYSDSNQICASFFLVKKSAWSLRFFEKFLAECENIENISENTTIPQSPDFIDHRHDQSIFSLLYKLNDLKVYRDPSQFGVMPWLYSGRRRLIFKDSPTDYSRIYRPQKYNETYGTLLIHHRFESPLLTFFKVTCHYLQHRVCGYR